VVSCLSPIGVETSTPGPLRWKLCSSERSLTERSYVPGSTCATRLPAASRSEITNASFVPTTATSFGLSARATAEGRASAASRLARAVRVATPGLYGKVRGSDLSERDPCRDQQ